ncbi:hypothetical protein DBR11_16210 [Pedobacter sp. HMWF019]|uniref:hypothetical protein n=1 Tax=Pedobacter sp. HMWF019 TaxID=2056856 RepID=UPI000D37E1A9|nr:hypothetical protein [Pedobacter sp. HMWF019]PTS97893.1 hypothetical protein DBR11_16210 [Pedobacter sp. HMWF019]
MNLQIQIKDLCAFNVKANQEFLQSLDQTSTELWKEKLYSNFSDIQREIQQIVSVDGAVMELSDTETIARNLVSRAEELLRYVNDLPEALLREEVQCYIRCEGQVRMPRYERIQQIIVYSAYKRGLIQIIS